MNKIQLSVDGISTTPLSIGFEGEQNHTQVTFYWTSLFNRYPDAVATMVIKPPTGDPYPKTVTQDDNRVIWDVAASDTTIPGNGSYQLTFTDGEEIIKTYIGAYNVMESITGNGEAPTPVEDWVTEANAVLAEFETDIAKINDKQDAPETAGTAGQVLGLNNSLEPVWVNQSGGGGSAETWELIKEVTTTENVADITVDTDSNGQSFKLRKMTVTLSAGQPTTGTKDSFYTLVGVKIHGGNTGQVSAPSMAYATATSNLVARQVIEAEPNMPLFELSVSGTSEGNTRNAEMMPKVDTFADYITSYKVYQTAADKSYIPSGAVLKVFGVRTNG